MLKKTFVCTHPPQRATTRRSTGKAAADQLTLPLVASARFTFHEIRFTHFETLRRRQGTPLADFFSILLERNALSWQTQQLVSDSSV